MNFISMILAHNRWPIAALTASICLLAAAHFFEQFMNLYPCPLCLRQREVLWAVVAVSVLGIVIERWWDNPRLGRIICVFIGVLFLAEAGIASYHTGVEQGWISSGCASVKLDDLDILKGLSEKTAVGSCSDSGWSFLGLTMANWNVVIAIFLAICSFFSASRTYPERIQEA